MIDGGLFKEDVEERNIQGVPTIFLNDEFFSSGRTDTSKIINKLKTIYPNIGSKTERSRPNRITPTVANSLNIKIIIGIRI